MKNEEILSLLNVIYENRDKELTRLEWLEIIKNESGFSTSTSSVYKFFNASISLGFVVNSTATKKNAKLKWNESKPKPNLYWTINIKAAMVVQKKKKLTVTVLKPKSWWEKLVNFFSFKWLLK